MSTVDIFDLINNALIDLQGADYQTYERPLLYFSNLFQDDALKPFRDELVKGLDFDAFISESEKTMGSMVGSAKLLWPKDRNHQLGLTLLLIDKLSTEPEYILRFGHQFYYADSKVISDVRSVTRQVLIPFVRDFKTYVMSRGVVKPAIIQKTSRKVFIVHGHDGSARESVARFLERIGFEAIILHEQANRGRTVIEKVEANSDVSFAVVLLTPDDEGSVKGGPTEPRVRQNVLIELGYFIGKLGRDRVCALKKGKVEIPSDFAGVVWQEMDDVGGWKQALGRELKEAGHAIDWNIIMS